MLLSTAACGWGSPSSSSSSDALTIFTTSATYEGKLDGWTGKLVKDKTGLSIDVVPSVVGGTDRFQTRLTTGNLGDIIILKSRDALEDAIKAGAVEDLSGVSSKLDNAFRFTDAIDRVKQIDDGKVYGLPMGVTNEHKATGVDPKTVPSMRYDYYKELGSPEIHDFWDYKDVAKEMVAAHPKTEEGNNFYGLSLFSEWDKTNISQIAGIGTLMGLASGDGINNYSFIAIDPLNKKTVRLLDEDSYYMQGLQWANDFYREGLLDPDSATQTWESYLKKAQNGQSAIWLLGYMGNYNFNPTHTDMTAQKKGYERIPFETLDYAESTSTFGSGWYYCVSSKSKNKEGAYKFLNWIYSDEGAWELTNGPEGMLWEMNDQKQPVLTELGKKDYEQTVPEEYGGGKIGDNYAKRVNGPTLSGVIEQYGYPAGTNEWPESMKENQTELDKDWSADHAGALNMKEYMLSNDQVHTYEVKNVPAVTWSDTDSVVASQVGDVIKQYSWKMVYAKDDAEFNSLKKEMISKAKNLGLDKLVATEEKTAQTFFDAK